MRTKATFVFIVTTLLYGATLASSSYVGVDLTYAALIILLVSGYIMLFGRSKSKSAETSSSVLVESIDAVSGMIGDFNEAMDGINDNLARLNRKNELKRARTEKERAAERQLRLKRIECDAHLRYASSDEDKTHARAELAAVDRKLAALREAMMAIEKQCEIDAITEQRARLRQN